MPDITLPELKRQLASHGASTSVASLWREGLWTTISELLNAFKPVECANYFAAAGYDDR